MSKEKGREEEMGRGQKVEGAGERGAEGGQRTEVVEEYNV